MLLHSSSRSRTSLATFRYQLPTVKMLAMRRVSAASKAPVLPRRAAAPARLVCRAQKQEQEQKDSIRQAAVAGLVAAALLSSSIVPEEALAARSSGRAGGSGGFAARKYSGGSR